MRNGIGHHANSTIDTRSLSSWRTGPHFHVGKLLISRHSNGKAEIQECTGPIAKKKITGPEKLTKSVTS